MAMRVWDGLAQILVKEGVEQLFCFPSTPLIDAAAVSGIRPYVCRQERVGVGMADGFARMTSGRRTGVFAMQSGPGSENAYPGVATAFADSSPVVLLPQGLPKERASLSPNFDSARAFAAVTKSFERVPAPELLVPAMRRAFHQLRSGRPGPVMVEIPSDVGALEVADISNYVPVSRSRSAADPADVDRAAETLLAAAHPLILAGAGVLYAEASEELTELAVLSASPVATTVGGKSSFPENHPLSIGVAGLTAGDHAVAFWRQADVILAVGASLTRGSILTPNVPAGAKLIHCSNDPRDIGKSYFVEHGLVGDAKLVLSQLVEAVRDRTAGRTHRDVDSVAHEIAAARAAWLSEWKPRLESQATPIDSYRVIHDFMSEVDPADAVVTHDSGGPRDQLVPFYVSTVPRSYIGWGKSHALGTGVGLAMGAKAAAPDRLCVHFMGDAAFGMTGLDLETAVRSGLPTLSIVLNNGAMAVETASLARSHEMYRSRALGGDYTAVARGLGLYAERVERPSEIVPALRRARSEMDNGNAALLEFITADEAAFSNFYALGR
jgi:acetolactate synthase-1/2/3 large subunit